MLVPGIYTPKSTIFLYLKSTMVICTYSVHITTANFLQYFRAKINPSTSQEAHLMFGKIFSACCRYLFHLSTVFYAENVWLLHRRMATM